MKNLKYISLFFLGSILGLGLYGQIRIGTHFQNELVQRSSWNPAAMQDVDIQISLLGIQPFIGNSGFSISDGYVEIPGTDSVEFSVNKVLERLDEENVIRSDAELDWFAVNINLEDKGIQLGLSFGNKTHSQFVYSPELIGLLALGNAEFIGETIEVGPQISAFAYSDLGVSIAKKFGDKFQVGGRIHYLNGSFALNTNRHQVELLTSEEIYQLDMNMDYELNASFPGVNILDSVQFGVFDETDLNLGIGFSQNHGLAFDLSALYRPIENMEISAGIQGLGFINWQNNSSLYSSKGQFTFNGLEPRNSSNRPVFERLLDLDFSGVGDSILTTFSVESEQSSFSTSLPRRAFLAASYSPMEKIQLGVTFQNEQFQEVSRNTLGLYGGLKINRFFSFGLSYANDSEFGGFLGTHYHLNLGPLQTYASIDNISTLVAPSQSRAVVFRLGTNLLIGKRWNRSSKDKIPETIQTDL
ncbi:MAG: DUF5723 family protein [Bacteroidia bacterium]|nr:DUF5723 family protein [Bacteroidia bacterium]